MERRDFIKISALSGVMATLEGCRSAEKQLIRFVPEEELVPGMATWKPSVCTLCSAGCGLLVRVMQGEAEVVRRGQQGLRYAGDGHCYPEGRRDRRQRMPRDLRG